MVRLMYPATGLTLGSIKHVLPIHRERVVCLIVPEIQDLHLLYEALRSLKVFRKISYQLTA